MNIIFYLLTKLKKSLISLYSILVLILFPDLVYPYQISNMSPEEILSHLQSTFNEIKDYTVQLHAEIDMENINVPPMDVTVYFKQPDKIHLQSEGFAILPREGMFVNPGRFTKENFYISLLGTDTVKSVETYKLELVPRSDEIMVRKFILWIAPVKWVILKMNTISWQGQSAQISFEYTKIKNKYWMPKSTVADINLAGFKGFSNMMKMPGREEKKDEDASTKKGKINIRFFNYKINTGLSDSLFENE